MSVIFYRLQGVGILSVRFCQFRSNLDLGGANETARDGSINVATRRRSSR